MSIEQQNRIIAEFMNPDLYRKWNDQGDLPIDQLKYHDSWSWLMPVVEKIEALRIEEYETIDNELGRAKVIIFGRCCDIQIDNAIEDNLVEVTAFPSKIQAVYEAVIQFIQWYNTQNTSPT